jgi:hypothetical protein
MALVLADRGAHGAAVTLVQVLDQQLLEVNRPDPSLQKNQAHPLADESFTNKAFAGLPSDLPVAAHLPDCKAPPIFLFGEFRGKPAPADAVTPRRRQLSLLFSL